MPKIIKHGTKYKFTREALYGHIVTGKNCSCEFEITKDTKFSHFTGGLMAGSKDITCPECGITSNELTSWKK